MSAARILAINPGGTSTKVALFEGEREVFSSTVRHFSASAGECSNTLRPAFFQIKKAPNQRAI